MENNYLILNPISARLDKEQELAILFLDIPDFTGLMESQPEQTMIEVIRNLLAVQPDVLKHEQQARLVGKPYSMYDDIDYFLAIAG